MSAPVTWETWRVPEALVREREVEDERWRELMRGRGQTAYTAAERAELRAGLGRYVQAGIRPPDAAYEALGHHEVARVQRELAPSRGRRATPEEVAHFRQLMVEVGQRMSAPRLPRYEPLPRWEPELVAPRDEEREAIQGEDLAAAQDEGDPADSADVPWL